MSLSLIDLPAEEAWLPFEPSDREPFDRRAAAHLYRRAGFGATLAELDEAVKDGPHGTVQRLFSAPANRAEYYAEIGRFAQSVLAGNSPESLSSWWLHIMRHSSAPLWEKTTLFWHGHFATSAAKVKDAGLLLRQNQLLRKHAYGTFEAMVKGIARDPAMLLYLDSATNRKTHPNENFAREVMELFCLGVGNYTEQDIQQLARCFTGWEIQHGEFKFNPYQHDEGVKHLFGRSGKWDGDEAIRLIVEQPTTAEFICRKLARFFVADEVDWSPELLQPLVNCFREMNFTAAVVKMILSSRLFFHPQMRGAKVRSPVELGIGLLRSLDATANLRLLVEQLRELGQLPLYPPNVKGWNGGREWINASTILGRANLARQLIESPTTQFGGASLGDYLAKWDLKTPEQIVQGWSELLLAVEMPGDLREQLVARLNGGANREAALRQTLHLLASLPEFQLA
jgi:hypothetical protein